MATKSLLFCLGLCILLLHGCVAQIEQQGGWQSQQQLRQPQRRYQVGQSQCQIQSLNAQEPNRRFESEAGVTEFWDQTNEQFDCTGVSATQHIIQPRGLLLPSFANAPRLMYILILFTLLQLTFISLLSLLQIFITKKFNILHVHPGRGMTGRLRERGQQQRSRDQHQKIPQIQQGDIVALPTGVAHWCYNEGETPLVMVVVHDTSNNANQLDRNLRKFQLAGSQLSQTGSAYQQQQQQQQQQRRRQQEIPTNNIFNGFDVETLAEAFGVSTETARKLQGQSDQRGNIRGEEEESEEQYRVTNGLEDTICSMRLKQNIANPARADIYSENGGRITSLNIQNAERGVLYQNALVAPQWHMNAHSVIYVTRGNARVQVVDNAGRQVFNAQLNEGQILVVPQNFAVVKQAGNEGFEWVAFKTNDNALMSQLVGKTSALRAMPADVLMNAYQISREEANRLKNNRREETLILTPGLRSQVRLALKSETVSN
ncbi:hypothetical protein MKX01_031283 [Papaver californicum]|nr:hypothetical protein MKX01_031283 [Papaver californicum]